jgi:hypothetical protein
MFRTLPIFLKGIIWLNIGICQTLGFSILKMYSSLCLGVIYTEPYRGSRIFNLLDYRCLTTEFVFAKEFSDQSAVEKAFFIIFTSFYTRKEFLGPKK